MDTDKYLQTMISNMPEKTGKSLEEWKKILVKKNFAKHGDAMKFLKEENGVTHGFANTIVTLSKEEKKEPENLEADQYAGKEALLPIYNKLKEIILDLGKDIEVSPKKTSMSFIRKWQFALVKPATKSRIDLGLKLPGVANEGILQDSGPFGTMCTHRIQLSALEDINTAVKKWLKEAYKMSK